MTVTVADAEQLAALLGPTARRCRRGVAGPEGVALAPLTDHHLHLHLVDEHALPPHGIAAAVDLGGDPAHFARRPKQSMPHLEYAGAFLTVPGGYPSFRSWAPAQIVEVVTNASAAPGVPGGARTSVDEMADAGASVIKIALNLAEGPVFDEATLRAVVDAAHQRGLPAVAHVEGDGMTAFALDAGVDVLAHAPFTEALDAALIERAVAAGQIWISTLAIHDQPSTAIANVAAFAAAGGRVLYGTDLGNGERPSGLLVDELRCLHEAGVAGPALIASLTDPWPRRASDAGVATFVPGPAPESAEAIPAWLGGARVVPREELIADEY